MHDDLRYTFVVSVNAKLTPAKDVDLINIGLLTDPEYHEVIESVKDQKVQAKIMRPGEDGWHPKNKRTVRSVTKIFGGFTTTIQLQMTELDVNEVNSNPVLAEGVEWT